MPLSPGTRLGAFQVIDSLGAGGMGEVYRARDLRLGRDIAIKVLPDAFSRDPDRLARFSREQEAQKIADSWLGRFGLGRAYLQAGAFTEASSEFEECVRRRGEAVAVYLDDVPTYHLLDPSITTWSAPRLGSPGAAESYRLFLAPKAERSDDPLVADARRREKVLR